MNSWFHGNNMLKIPSVRYSCYEKKGDTSILTLPSPISWTENTARSSIQCGLEDRNILWGYLYAFLKTLKFNHILLRVGEIWRVAVLTPDLYTPDEGECRDYSMISSLRLGKTWPPCTRVLDSSIDPLIIRLIEERFRLIMREEMYVPTGQRSNLCA